VFTQDVTRNQSGCFFETQCKYEAVVCSVVKCICACKYIPVYVCMCVSLVSGYTGAYLLLAVKQCYIAGA